MVVGLLRTLLHDSGKVLLRRSLLRNSVLGTDLEASSAALHATAGSSERDVVVAGLKCWLRAGAVRWTTSAATRYIDDWLRRAAGKYGAGRQLSARFPDQNPPPSVGLDLWD